MGCFSHRSSNAVIRPEQKWDYIQLDDFKASNGFTYVAYGYVFVSLFISIAVYTVDTFTAINLLVFNKWSSEIQPAISFDVAKWIFSICIILSAVNVAYEHIRAQMIIRRGSVAESYLDNLAVRIQSIRLGGKGWRRFLVFAELTKSKKGAEYIALFTYFSFQAWIRIIFCSGPRQVVNAVTLYSVYSAKLQVDGDNFESSLESLWDKIKVLAEQDYQQALILSGMCFTLIIWVFSALSLILAALFFVFFLWGWIPREDGGLSGYCERKINKRLMKIVSKKVDAAIADQEQKRKKAELKAAKKAGELPPEERKATLPTLMPDTDDKLPDMPMLTRQDTVATLPVYTSRPGTPSQGGFELNKMPPMPARADTTLTASSRAPLLQAGADMGRSSPSPSMPSPYGPPRSDTMSSMRVPMGQPPLNRIQTNTPGFGNSYTETPGTYSVDTFPSMPQPVRSPTSMSTVSYGMPPRSTPAPRGPYDEYANGPVSPVSVRQMPSYGQFDDYSSNGRASPAPSRPMPPRSQFDDYSSNGPVSPVSVRQMPSHGQFDDYSNGRASPAPSRPMPPRSQFDDYSSNGRASPAPSRQMPPRGQFDDYSSNGRASPAPSRQMPPRGQFDDYSNGGRASPAPSRPMGPSYGQGGYPGYGQGGGYLNRSQTGPIPPRGPPVPQPQRNLTAPIPQRVNQIPSMEDYSNRPGTAQSQRSMGGLGQQQQQQQQQRQPTLPTFNNAYSDLESQRGTPGPRY